MKYNTLYVGMDVHKETFTLCCYDMEEDRIFFTQKVEADYKQVLKYLNAVRNAVGNDVKIICGYEAGCLGFTLYHQLTYYQENCVILAPSTMMQTAKKTFKTDKRDAANIAKCLAYHTYSPVHIPTKQDEQVKEYIRMRDDHKQALKKIKQQIISFCMRQGYSYTATKKYWTNQHLTWLQKLDADGLHKEILEEYLLSYHTLTDRLERIDQRIEELAADETYHDSVKKLSCFIGIKTHTALATIVEIGDFKRFPSAERFASYLGLVPGEDSSGNTQKHLSITKAGNSHVRRLLVEAAQSYVRGQPGYKSATLKDRQAGNPTPVVGYADKANERLRRRYRRMVLNQNKRPNVAKTAIARELACFIWGMMTDNIA